MGNAAEEREWVRRAREGDHRAYGLLIERHQARVYGLVARLLGPGHGAIEDVTQDVFVKAYFSLNKFRGDASFGTWIYRMAINRARDELRKRSGYVSLEGVNPESLGGAVESFFAGLQQEGEPSEPPEELRRLIGRALAALPEKLRVVAVLKEIEGHSYTEVSRILKCAVGTVKSRQSQARRRLREFLEPYMKEKERQD
ncbi:sigma-70 family RNA polymerase sigma factor [Nitrospinota bacterium]